MSTQEHSLIKTLRCPSCGGPMKPSAESLLVICNFCGEIVAESNVTPHAIVKALPMTPPEGPGLIRNMDLILVPFFEVRAEVNVDALGYQRRERTETRTVRRGNQTVTESKTIVEYRPWRIQYSGTQAIRFLARQEVSLFGVNELISTVARSVGGEPITFNPQYIKDLASKDSTRSLIALSPEWNQNEASKKAGETFYEAAYSKAKSEMHEVFDTKVVFKPLEKPILLHEPMLIMRRKIGSGSYRAAFHWGNGQLLREELPIKNRGLMIFIALVMFIAAPPLVQVGYTVYANSSESESWLLIILGIIAAIFVGLGIFLVFRAYKPHKVKSCGTKISMYDFQAIAKPTQTPPPAQQSAETKSGLKFCPKCGDPLEQNQKFCEICGYNTSER